MESKILDIYKIEGTINLDQHSCFNNPNTFPQFQAGLNHFKYHLINKYVEIFGDKIWIQLKNNNDKFYLIISRKYTFSK